MTGPDDNLTPLLPSQLRREGVDAGDWMRVSHISDAPDAQPTRVQATNDTNYLPGEAPLPTVPGYEVLGVLGHGGMGVVYRARHLGLNRVVALKMILVGAHAGLEARRRMMAEARTIAQLQHPNIVQIFDVGEHEGLPYCALELLPGGSLDKHIRGQPQPPKVSAQLLATLARAVHAAHEKGIVHRDLKPANILLSAASQVLGPKAESEPSHSLGSQRFALRTPKVSDFGLAKDIVADSKTASGSVLGTPEYMAPEQAEGKNREVGPSADTYALGAIFYELLTGRVPFLGVTALEVLWQVQMTEPVSPRRLMPTVPLDLETICLKCLQKDPVKRYRTAAALADDLERYLRNEPIVARPVGWRERTWKWCRRRPAVATLLAALAVVVTGSLIGLTALYLRAEELYRVAKYEQEEAVKAQQTADTARQAAVEGRDEGRKLIELLASKDQLQSLAQQPSLTPEQRKTLSAVVDYYRKYVSEAPHTPEERQRQAAAYERLAMLEQVLGLRDQAAEAARQEMALYESLATESPNDPKYRAAIAKTLVTYGSLLEDLNRRSEAETALRKATGLWEQLIQTTPNDPNYLSGSAMAGNRLAVFVRRGGRLPEAANLYERAAERQAAALARGPRNPAGEHMLAGIHAERASLAIRMGRTGEAEESLGQALTVMTRLVDEFPAVAMYRNTLAGTHSNLALLLAEQRRVGEAEEHYRQAIAISERLAAEFPGMPEYRKDAARCRSNFGNLWLSVGNWPQAEAEFRATLPVRQNLAAEHPGFGLYRMDLAVSYDCLATALANQGQVREAEAAYRQALTLREQLVKEAPAMPQHRWRLAKTNANLGLMLAKSGKPAEAEPLIRRAVEIAQALTVDVPTATDYRHDLGNYRLLLVEALLAAGKTEEALAVVDHAAAGEADGARLCNLACVCAKASAAVKNDAKVQDQFAARAVELLTQAVAKGYKDLARFQTDESLKPLQDRSDFKKFLASLQNPSR